MAESSTRNLVRFRRIHIPQFLRIWMLTRRVTDTSEQEPHISCDGCLYPAVAAGVRAKPLRSDDL